MGQTHTPIHPYHANRVCILVKVEDPFLFLSLSLSVVLSYSSVFTFVSIFTRISKAGWKFR